MNYQDSLLIYVSPFFPVFLYLILVTSAVNGAEVNWQEVDQLPEQKASILFNEVPYKTNDYYRITYTLETWQFDKDNLDLKKIVVVDHESKETLFVVDEYRLSAEAEDFENKTPKLILGKLPENPYFNVPNLTSNYITLQLPLKRDRAYPSKLSHLFYFQNTKTNEIEIYHGAPVIPRYEEQALVIDSPVKGRNLLFLNQSTMAYHVDSMLLTEGGYGRGERFAFDYIRVNDDLTNYFAGDHTTNQAYFCYGDVIYAVADGVIETVVDGLPENSGDLKDIEFNTLIEAAGNYVLQKLEQGYYALYAHIIPGSIIVKNGDQVIKGQPIAKVGNSGNSDCPHLHFQITKGNDIFMSEGVPFVFEQYSLTGTLGQPPFEQQITFRKAMMEQFSVVDCE